MVNIRDWREYRVDSFSLEYTLIEPKNKRQIQITADELGRTRVILLNKYQDHFKEGYDSVTVYSIRDEIFIFDVKDNKRAGVNYVIRIFGDNDKKGKEKVERVARKLGLKTTVPEDKSK